MNKLYFHVCFFDTMMDMGSKMRLNIYKFKALKNVLAEPSHSVSEDVLMITLLGALSESR